MLNRFNSNARKLNRIIPAKVNAENLINADLTGSLQNIKLPTSSSFQSHTKSNPNPIKLVNNKTKINEFHDEILQFSGKSIKKGIDSFDNQGFGKLIINNTKLDYGTEGVSPDNFEVIVYGLHLPGNYTIRELDGNVVISLGDNYIDFDSIVINDIYVIGKFINT